MVAPALWFLAIQVVALATLPLTIRVFRSLPDRGYGFAKPVGIVLLGYLAWLTSMIGLTSFARPTIALLGVALGTACWCLGGRECLVFVRARWRLLLAFEAMFCLALVIGTFVRAHNADILGQEKFMDFALMNAFLSASDLPAEDPWLAGFGVPYYHLGYLILGLPGRISGTPGPVTYNLAVAFVFACAFSGAATIVYGLLAPLRPGLSRAVDWGALVFAILGGVMVAVLGNLEAPFELLAATGYGDAAFWQSVGIKGLAANPSGGWLPADGAWWWRAARVIPNIQPDGITEFPYFSFLLGDLHPHYTALILDLPILGLGLARWLDDGQPASRWQVLVGALLLAVLVAANTWDVPTFWGFLFGLGVIDVWRRGGESRALLHQLPRLGAPFLLAGVLIAPYFVGYQSQPLGLGFVAERTPLGSLLILFGPTLLLALVLAGWSASRGRRLVALEREQAPFLTVRSLLIGGALALLLLVVGEPTLALLSFLMTLVASASWGWLRSHEAGHERLPSAALFCSLLPLGGLLVLTVVELIFLRDVFGSRMNTVFKFHYNAWLFLALGGAAGLGLIWTSSAMVPRGRGWQLASVALVGLVIGPGLVYPLAATWTKSGRFANEPTLDGSRFLRLGQPSDYDAIQWLRANGTGRPVVVEAVGPDYGEHARVSTFSGLPTIMGWVGHELQWRGERPEIGRRQGDVDAIYRASTREELLDRAGPYRARYVFFGGLERDRYGPETRQRLGTFLSVAFARGETVVYAVPSEQIAAQTR